MRAARRATTMFIIRQTLSCPLFYPQRERAINDFNLHTPTRILFGKGAIAGSGDQIPQDARVLVIYGGGSVKKNRCPGTGSGRAERPGRAGVWRYQPNPSYETLMNAVKIVRDEKVTFLLAVGGGSVLDGTKFIAAAAQYADGIDHGAFWKPTGNDVTSAIPIGSVLPCLQPALNLTPAR
ncbi:iron-containing alcohol dehydrogenase [Shigella flexneri]